MATVNHTPQGVVVPFIARGRAVLIEIEQAEHYTCYRGKTEDLLDAKVITPNMIPEGKKRVRYRLGPDIPREQKYELRKIKGGRLELIRRRRHAEDDGAMWLLEYKDRLCGLLDAGFALLMLNIQEGCYLIGEFTRARDELKETVRTSVLKFELTTVKGGQYEDFKPQRGR